MPTSNVVVSRTGTGWTVDVTACDLLPDTNIKDFIVLHNSVVVSNVPYTKTTPTTLTYTGSSLASGTTVEIRRKTPNSVIQPVTYGQKLSSSLWNSELDRVTRWREEVDLNGAGLVVSTPTPQNDPFGVAWSTDTVYPSTRKAAYDIINTLAPKDGANLTNATATTQPTTNNTTLLATTAYVQNNLANYASLSSPTLTGDPKATTPSNGDNDTSIATTAFVQATCRPNWGFFRNTGGSSTTSDFAVVVPSGEYFDSDNSLSAGGVFTVPAGLGGLYAFGGYMGITNLDTSTRYLGFSVRVNGSTEYFSGQVQLAASVAVGVSCSLVLVRLSVGDTVSLVSRNYGTGLSYRVDAGNFFGFRIGS